MTGTAYALKYYSHYYPLGEEVTQSCYIVQADRELLCRPGWSQTGSDLSVSVSQEPRSQSVSGHLVHDYS